MQPQVLGEGDAKGGQEGSCSHLAGWKVQPSRKDAAGLLTELLPHGLQLRERDRYEPRGGERDAGVEGAPVRS